MKSLVFICAILVQCCWSYDPYNSAGAGAFTYEDSTGHRYECVYKPKYNHNYEPPEIKRFNEVNPVEQYWPGVIANIENQQRAVFEAAQNSYGPFNEFPYIPTFDFRYPQHNHFNYFGSRNRKPFDMSGQNTPYDAFAYGAVGPGFKQQEAAINPSNPQSPNVRKFSQNPGSRNGADNHFYSVSSSAVSSSVDKNGELQSQRAAETIVNDNGKVTKYSVHS
ncbi:unnamed protein product [Parnassius mnemosyne]|uniref:Uncharacterized protein n=1 Tax=Parnassius mnemosyne TaxID=213953 RepID=A0AAV1M3R0_9NEOP